MIVWLEKWRAKRAARKFLKSCAKNPSQISQYWTPTIDENGNPIKDEEGKVKYWFHPYEIEITRRGENTVVKEWNNYQKEEAKLNAKINYLETKRELFEKLLEKGKEYLNRLKSLDYPPVEPSIYYFIFLFFLSLLEMPFNMVAFRKTGIPEYTTILLSLGTGIVIMAIAHWVGESIKTKKKIEIIISIVLFIVIMAFLYSLAVVRSDSHETITFMQLTQEEAKLYKKVYFLMSIIMFLVAVVVSYKNHEGRNEVKNLLSEIKNTFRCKSFRLGKKVQWLELKINKLDRKITILENEKIKLLDNIKNELSLIKNSVKTYINIYREEIRNRAYKYKELKELVLNSPRSYPSFKWRNEKIEEIMKGKTDKGDVNEKN